MAVQTSLSVFWGFGVDENPTAERITGPAPQHISVWIARMVVVGMWLLTIVLSATLAALHHAQEHFYGPRPVSRAPSRSFRVFTTFFIAVLVLCERVDEV
jgi:hypothetical protein